MKIKEHQAISANFFFTLLALCIKLNDELMCLTASLNLNVKQFPECMQEGGWKLRRLVLHAFIIHCGKKICSDCSSQYIEGLIHSVSNESPTLSQIYDSDTQILILYSCITEAYPVLKHWWVVYAILLLC